MQSVVQWMQSGGWGRSPQIGSARAVLSLTTHDTRRMAALVGSLHAPLYRPCPSKGVIHIAYIRISLTPSEAPVVADALDAYRQSHDLHRLYQIRLQQLADGLRDARARMDAQDRGPS